MKDHGVLAVVLAVGLARWSFELDSVEDRNLLTRSACSSASMQVFRTLPYVHNCMDVQLDVSAVSKQVSVVISGLVPSWHCMSNKRRFKQLSSHDNMHYDLRDYHTAELKS